MKKTIESMNFGEGEVLLFNKPAGWTSFDVVKKVRAAARNPKTGHAGTLDPLAKGLLILCTGKKTKAIQAIQDAPKEYVAEIQFGATTPCYDLEKEPENFMDPAGVTLEKVEDALKNFTGEILQTPPDFSAIKIDGKRAMDMARKGETIEMKARPVTIYSIEIISLDPAKRLTIRVACSKGTYIRSLAHDLGQDLGCGAYLAGLVRTKIGEYNLEDAWEIDEFVQLIKNSRKISSENPTQNPA